MEEQKTNEKTSTDPSSAPIKNFEDGHDLPLRGGDTPVEEDIEKTREPKKRKGCQTAPDKCGIPKKKKNSPLNSSYSFTFDTTICGGSGFPNTPESTPKFGSFNLAANTLIKRKEDDDEEHGKEDEVKLERSVD